ncbi:PilN domain-containing protein [Hydrogenophaga sp.]|jgi:type IV pilus assembly protein PilN|uniref:PilN domain-containing protein n=1 Tax=Hydrogenophaga sp. TaxID=1904254 RepID=UPI002719E694|nr:PilN domain-containing protein [Hydrogenophaga sp.]MDO9252356.1 PilN domain-containing protein [Hydrogenophaga sp.]MDP2405477.1 PilN domain-containing protein [Hydrogenophaga sp.]MDP3324701.1 PilN domain-containing protein [Hydrogenophaga sp.]MDP3883619.1 PilN domain-containing protein [Hydrogenophaga sp.]MDZ4177241.1 PilN domain-containing protein [Hydrogenophaga sp.]
MILINLLPHREAARKKQKEQFFTQLGLSVLLGGIICGALFTLYQGRIAEQQQRNSFLQNKTKELDAEIKDIASLQAQIASLRARQTAVEDLQADRNMPVHLLDELVAQLPDGIYLKSMKQENQSVLLEGVAQSQERVSELLRNLANNSSWLGKPELIEIVAANAAVSNREQRRVSNFKIRVALNRPAGSNASGQGASGAALPVPGKV